MVELLCKAVGQDLKELNTEVPHDPTVPLLGVHPRALKTYAHTKTCMLMFLEVFTTAKKWKQPSISSG